MGTCVWRTHDGGVRAQVHSPPQGCDLETTRLPTSGPRVALPRAAQPGDRRVGRERTQMPWSGTHRGRTSQAAHGLQGSTERGRQGRGAGRVPVGPPCLV